MITFWEESERVESGVTAALHSDISSGLNQMSSAWKQIQLHRLEKVPVDEAKLSILNSVCVCINTKGILIWV